MLRRIIGFSLAILYLVITQYLLGPSSRETIKPLWLLLIYCLINGALAGYVLWDFVHEEGRWRRR